ncbi:GAF domain-containing protein [Agreia pratensis]|uniref:GAF domain-containing protein n=1 Tax=Agreia pratensis TaxID=150121 RepID=A0A1X7KV81_9MICO|nr:GAF domain-containing protein [Agreia pratensis]SMG45386.1 GAF domain-containing protein [Agreia pratensis]
MIDAQDALRDLVVAARRSPGATLVTISTIDVDQDQMTRVYSTDPESYPVGDREKPLREAEDDPWYERVVVQQQPWVSLDVDDLRATFADYELIESLGCGAIINVPVVREGTTIGSINLLDAAGRYDLSSVDAALALAARIVPVLASLAN